MQATPIFLNSDATDPANPVQYNDYSVIAIDNTVSWVRADNVRITPHPLWNPNGPGDYWISFTNSGYGDQHALPNVPDPITLPAPNPPTAIFYHEYDLTGPAWDGRLSIWADDTARVYIDNTLLTDSNPTQGSACTNAPIGCITANGAHFDLSGAQLAAGHHVLRIEAYQRGGDTFGVQYAGQIDPVPEPATLAVVGVALVGLGAAFRRKQR